MLGFVSITRLPVETLDLVAKGSPSSEQSSRESHAQDTQNARNSTSSEGVGLPPHCVPQQTKLRLAFSCRRAWPGALLLQDPCSSESLLGLLPTRNLLHP